MSFVVMKHYRANPRGIQWTGTMEWNGGVEYWTGLLECHAHYIA